MAPRAESRAIVAAAPTPPWTSGSDHRPIKPRRLVRLEFLCGEGRNSAGPLSYRGQGRGEACKDVALGLERNVAAECDQFAGSGLEAASNQSGEPHSQLRLLFKDAGSVTDHADPSIAPRSRRRGAACAREHRNFVDHLSRNADRGESHAVTLGRELAPLKNEKVAAMLTLHDQDFAVSQATRRLMARQFQQVRLRFPSGLSSV